jgi:hypothetical protein
MKNRAAELDHLISAMTKIDAQSSRWQNVFAFCLSCYSCRVMPYDLDAATQTLNELAAEEQSALICWLLEREEKATQQTERLM